MLGKKETKTNKINKQKPLKHYHNKVNKKTYKFWALFCSMTIQQKTMCTDSVFEITDMKGT